MKTLALAIVIATILLGLLAGHAAKTLICKELVVNGQVNANGCVHNPTER